MKIKNYKCKCGYNDFFFADKGNQKGIYCTYCGKWLKWADKDEQNLTLKQEPKSEWQHDHEILKAYSDGANEVLEKIRTEIEQNANRLKDSLYGDGLRHALEIIDKYKDKAESEGDK